MVRPAGHNIRSMGAASAVLSIQYTAAREMLKCPLSIEQAGCGVGSSQNDSRVAVSLKSIEDAYPASESPVSHHGSRYGDYTRPGGPATGESAMQGWQRLYTGPIYCRGR